MLNGLLLAVLAGAPLGTGSWTAPRDPDPQKILSEASKDSQEGRHDVALAKLLWFHHNALEHDQALSGVRLSFALSYWFDLAQVHPPALEALKKTRDDALEKFTRLRGKDGAFESFHEFVSINEKLGEEALTARTFAKLHAESPANAEQIFHVARGGLIAAREYELCGRYMRPEQDWLQAAQLYHLNRSQAERFGAEHTEYLEKAFTNEVATLLALLVVNGRQEEAGKIAEKARLEWDDEEFRSAIASALSGVVPDPWP